MEKTNLSVGCLEQTGKSGRGIKKNFPRSRLRGKKREMRGGKLDFWKQKQKQKASRRFMISWLHKKRGQTCQDQLLCTLQHFSKGQFVYDAGKNNIIGIMTRSAIMYS